MNDKIKVSLKSMKIAEQLLRSLRICELGDTNHRIIWDIIVSLQKGIKHIETEVK